MQENRKKEIRIKADTFREKCKVSRYAIIDLFKECERFGYKLIRYPLGEGSALGFTVKKDSDTVIFTNTRSRLAREIFTLAHEIGHVLLHMENAASFVDDSLTIFGSNMGGKEQEANYFAACLLMPADEVKKFLDLEIDDFKRDGLSAIDIARIMSEFNVSFETALNRLESLGEIDFSERIRLDSEKNQTRVGNLLRSAGGNSRLNETGGEISIPYEYIDYVIYNYNHKAIPLETLEKALDCHHISVEDISDKLVAHTEDDDNLDALIGGLED